MNNEELERIRHKYKHLLRKRRFYNKWFEWGADQIAMRKAYKKLIISKQEVFYWEYGDWSHDSKRNI